MAALVEAVRRGDVWLFERTVGDRGVREFLLRKGVWKAVLCLRCVVQRGFFQRVHSLLGSPQKFSLRLVEQVLASLRVGRSGAGGSPEPLLADAVQLMAMRLLDVGYCKGFLRMSDDGGMMVLMKQPCGNFFPPDRLRKPPVFSEWGGPL
jgi:hypothetical protein|eukprot:SAG25_NODE_35_length_20155_cov_35.583815_10_plen_150_part_00